MPELVMPDPPLRSDAVLLRGWRSSDAPALFSRFNDPVVQRFSWHGAAPYRESDAIEYLVGQHADQVRGDALHWALVDAGDHDVLFGGASLYDANRRQSRASGKAST